MFFAGLFAAYFNVRATSPVWPPEGFAEKLHWLPTAEQIIPIVTFATILLITSSFTCQLGVWGIRRNDRTTLIRSIGVTVVLGATFLLLQLIDYSILYGEGPTRHGTFRTTTTPLTGFHFAHVLGGVIMLSVVLYRAMAASSRASITTWSRRPRCTGTSSTSSIVLFSVVYIIPNGLSGGRRWTIRSLTPERPVHRADVPGPRGRLSRRLA
jgi:cytochrome c oxidase subunit 3